MGNRLVSMALALVWVVGCGGSGGGDRGPVEVLDGEEAIQAAAVAALSLSTALVSILGEPRPNAGLATTGAGSPGSTSNTIARAIRLPCAQGGTADGECRESGGRTTITSTLDACGVRDSASGVVATASGRLRATYDRAGLCRVPMPPAGVPVTIELRNYREEQRLGESLVLAISADRLTQSLDPVGGGCSINDGFGRLDGDLRLRRAGVDLAMQLNRLELTVESAGNPCTEDVRASGRMDVTDLIRGSRFVADFEELGMLSSRAFDGVPEVTLTGAVDFDCLGRIDYSTAEPLALFSSCPSGGVLRIAGGGRDPAQASFSLDGIAIDYDGDGSDDFAAAACGRDSLAVCRR